MYCGIILRLIALNCRIAKKNKHNYDQINIQIEQKFNYIEKKTASKS